MENNLTSDIKKSDKPSTCIPVSLEFYGLPGCGKSTISHLVAKKLREQGYAVNELTYILDHKYPPNIRRFIKLFLSFIYSFIDNKSFCKILHIIGKSKKRIYINEIVNIMPKCWGYGNSKKYDFLIWDEGLIQSAVSSSLDDMPEEGGIISKEILKVASDKCKVIGVFLDFPIELVEERMIKRNTKDSRADRLQGEERTLFLKKFQKCLSLLDQHYIHITDYKKNLNEISQMIVQYIIDNK